MKFESNFIKNASKNLKESVKKSLDSTVSQSLRKTVKEKKDKVLSKVGDSVKKVKSNIGNQLTEIQNQVNKLQNSIEKVEKRMPLSEKLKAKKPEFDEEVEIKPLIINDRIEIETISEKEVVPEETIFTEVLEPSINDNEKDINLIEESIEERKPIAEKGNIFKSALEAFKRGRTKKIDYDNDYINEDDFDKDVPPAIPEIKIEEKEEIPEVFSIETPIETIATPIVTYPHTKLPYISPNKSVQSSNSPSEPLSTPIYADYASLTPIDPRVKKVMFEAMDQYPANPSSLYKKGVQAKKALDDARMSVASFFGANKNEIIFTSSGTESNSLIFQGILKSFYERGSNLESDKVLEKKLKNNESIKQVRPHFIISTIEHPSIIEIALDLINKDIDVSFIPVNKKGLVDPKDIKKALRPETILVSIIYANNEIGTIQPLKEISREVRHYKKGLGRDNSGYPYIHSDACQAALYEDMRINTLNIDLMSIDGGKVYGPRGIGAVVKKRHVNISPLFLGGNQENGLRAGTENIPAIIGLKHALDLAHSEREEQSARLLELRETLLEMIMSKLQDKIPGIMVNGTLEERLPNNLNICFPGIDAEFLVLRLDVLGIELSSVTSCLATNEDSSSYVIEALGRSDCALSSLRITLGRFTTTMDIGNIAEKICEAVLEQKGQKGKDR